MLSAVASMSWRGSSLYGASDLQPDGRRVLGGCQQAAGIAAGQPHGRNT